MKLYRFAHQGAPRWGREEGEGRIRLLHGDPFAGTRDALPPEQFLMRPARVTLKILEPIPVTGLDVSEAAALADRVHDMVLSERDALRREHADHS